MRSKFGWVCIGFSAGFVVGTIGGGKAKYVLGLTATPVRRDGQQPIIFMQCGPIRYTAAKPDNAPSDLEVIPQIIYKKIDLPQESPIQDVFRHIVNDVERTAAIAKEMIAAFDKGRKVLVLTERTEHLDAILQHWIISYRRLLCFTVEYRKGNEQH